MTWRLRSPKIRAAESDVARAVQDILRLRGRYPLRLQSALVRTEDGRRFRVGETGLPDFCVPHFFIETKRPGEKLSEAQERKIDELARFWRLDTAVVESPEDLILWLAEHPDL